MKMSEADSKLLLAFAADFESAENVMFHSGDREPGTEFSKSGRKKIAAAIRRVADTTTDQNDPYKSEQYFVIVCSEDGEASLVTLDKKKLVAHLNEAYWGPVHEMEDLARDLKASNFLALNEKAGVLIIKGCIVHPIAKNIVKQWDI